MAPRASLSPLQNMNMEAEVLVEILINAHERKVPIAEAYVEVTSNTGEEYIAFCEKKHGHAFRASSDMSRTIPTGSIRLKSWQPG